MPASLLIAGMAAPRLAEGRVPGGALLAGATTRALPEIYRSRHQAERISSRMVSRTTSAKDKPGAYCFSASFIMI